MQSKNFDWNNQAALANEGYSMDLKKKIIKISIPLSFLSFVASVFFIYFTWNVRMAYPNMSSFFFDFLLGIGVGGTIVSVLFFFWGLTHRIVKENDDSLDNNNLYETFLTIIATIQVILNISCIVYLSVENRFIRDFYIVENGQDGYQKFQEQYSLLFNFGTLSILVQLICFIYLGYTIYITSLTQFDAKVIVHLLNIQFLIFIFGTMWTIVYAQNYYDSIETMKQYVSDGSLHLLYYSALTGAFLALGIFVVNTFSSKINYVLIGAIVLFYLTYMTVLNRQIFGMARTVEKQYMQNCNSDNLIQQVSTTYLEYLHCSKYQQKELNVNGQVVQENGKPKITYNLQCPSDFLTNVWEDTKNPYAQSCLNMSCCQVMADNFSLWMYRVGFMNLSLVVTGFFLVGFCFILFSAKSPDFNVNLFGTNFSSFLIIIAIILGGFYIVQFSYDYPIPVVNKVGQIWEMENSDSNNNNYFQNYLVKSQYQFENMVEYQKNKFSQEGYVECAPFRDFLIEDVQIQNPCQGLGQCLKQVSLQVSTKHGSFKFSPNLFNDQRFKFGSLRYKNKHLLKDQYFEPFIQIQGFSQDINDFYNQELYYCGANPLNTPLFHIQNQVVDLSQQNIQHQSIQGDYLCHSHNIVKQSGDSNQSTLVKSLKQENNEELLNVQQAQTQLKYCQSKLRQLEEQYTDKCLKMATGDFSKQNGNFSTVWGYQQLSTKLKQQIIGSVWGFKYDCEKSNELQRENESNDIKNLVQIENAQITLSYLVDGKYIKITQIKTNKDGLFQLNIPTFYNGLKFQAKIEIHYSNGLKNDFLDYQFDILLGEYQTIQLKPIVLLTQTGFTTPINKEYCNKKQEEQNKESHQEIFQAQQIQQKIQQHALLPFSIQQQLKNCEEQSEAMQNSLKTCSINFDTIQIQNQNNQIHEEKISGREETQKNSNLLDIMTFTNVNLIVYDAKNKNKLDQLLKVQLYKDHHNCIQKPQSQYLQRELNFENNQSEQILSNVLTGYYTILIETQDYHTYCSNLHIYQQDEQDILIPLASNKAQISFVLEHKNQELSASLSMITKTPQGENSCLISNYNTKCDAGSLYNIENTQRLGQIIELNSLENQNYLIFVQKIPSSQTEKSIQEVIASGLSVPEVQLKNQIKNGQFWEGDLTLKMYVQERELQVKESTIPQISQLLSYYKQEKDQEQFIQSLMYDPTLTWLGFCVNGSFGDNSVIELDHFWKRLNKNDGSQLQWWQQLVAPGILNPDSQLCDYLYSQN